MNRNDREEDLWVSIDNLIDLLEDVMLKGRDIVGSEETVKYVKHMMTTVYDNVKGGKHVRV